MHGNTWARIQIYIRQIFISQELERKRTFPYMSTVGNNGEWLTGINYPQQENWGATVGMLIAGKCIEWPRSLPLR